MHVWSLALVAAGWLAVALFTSGFPAPEPAPPAVVTWPALSFQLAAQGMAAPVAATNAGDGSGRIFVTQQAGQVRIVTANGSGALLATPFLDITSRVVCCGERGLLSVAFPPDYANRGWFYVNYTGQARTTQGFTIVSGDTVIARYRRSAADPNLADPASEDVLLVVRQPYANHNGGQIAFSPSDGLLYVGMGDGGSADDPENFALRRRATLANGTACASCIYLGKLLRIDVETPALQGRPGFDVPATNPVIEGVRDAIWAYGLRNPWRFSFDRVTGDLYIADVGQGAREEIDVQPATSPGGENYQWACREGAIAFTAARCPVTAVGPGQPVGGTPPVFDYDRSLGGSVTGGFVYRGSVYNDLYGKYLFADYGGRIWGLVRDGATCENRVLRSPSSSSPPFNSISAFGEDEAGNVYVVDHNAGGNDGRLYRIVASGPLGGPMPSPTAPCSAQPPVLPFNARVPVSFKASGPGW